MQEASLFVHILFLVYASDQDWKHIIDHYQDLQMPRSWDWKVYALPNRQLEQSQFGLVQF
jgi:hypothetical protein